MCRLSQHHCFGRCHHGHRRLRCGRHRRRRCRCRQKSTLAVVRSKIELFAAKWEPFVFSSSFVCSSIHGIETRSPVKYEFLVGQNGGGALPSFSLRLGFGVKA